MDRPPSGHLRISRPGRAAQAGALLLVCALGGFLYWGSLAAAVAALTIAAIGVAIGWVARDAGPKNPSAEVENDSGTSQPAAVIGLIESLEIAAVLLDDQEKVQAHNRGAREIFPHVKTGQNLSLISRNPDLLNTVRQVRTGERSQSLEMVERFPVVRRLHVTVSPVTSPAMPLEKSAQLQSTFLLLQFRDLTEQDRLAQMRSDFIANASHELRTPLASLKGFIETLRGPARDDVAARQRFLGIMDAQASRMTRILDDLLSLSRIEMRTHLAPDGLVDIGALLTAVVQGLEPVARDAKITLRFDGGVVAHRVPGDRDELEQVFQNLAYNAIKYGHEGGQVEISVERRKADGSAKERVVVSVADNGPGIASEYLPRLTERFYRVDTATSRDRGGTGLGLAIVKHILVRHRGDLEIVSVVGKGSTFTVLLDALSDSIPATT